MACSIAAKHHRPVTACWLYVNVNVVRRKKRAAGGGIPRTPSHAASTRGRLDAAPLQENECGGADRPLEQFFLVFSLMTLAVTDSTLCDLGSIWSADSSSGGCDAPADEVLLSLCVWARTLADSSQPNHLSNWRCNKTIAKRYTIRLSRQTSHSAFPLVARSIHQSS